ncbi:MAG: hypothetical protein ACOYBK_02535 [Bilifractor sp.]|jgi:hypothetical protein|nr:hypothetical protein [Lachnospiraceae bacterium]
MKKRRYSFIEKDDNRKSRRSLCLTAVSGVMTIILFMYSSSRAGDVGSVAGTFGLIAAVFALIAFVYGVQALSGGEEKQRLAVISTVLSGVVLIIWFGVCLLGIHRMT